MPAGTWIYEKTARSPAPPGGGDGGVIPGSSITLLTGVDDTVERWTDLLVNNRSVFAPQTVTVHLSAYPQDITLGYNDSVNDIWLGWYHLTGPTTWKVSMPGGSEQIYAPLTTTVWKMLAALGKNNQNVAFSAMPGLVVETPGHSVARMHRPAATDITALTLTGSPGPDPNFPYNKQDDDSGAQYWSMPPLTYNDIAAYNDPNCWTVVAIVQDIDKNHNPIGPQHQLTDNVPGNTTVTLGPLIGPYGSVADPPRTGEIGGVRWRLFEISRLNQGPDAWADPNASTLQTGIGGGAGYIDVMVAPNGGLPPGTIDLGRGDPASLGTGLNADGGKINFGSDNLTNKVLNPYFDFGTPTLWAEMPAADIAHWQIAPITGNGVDDTGVSVTGHSLRIAANGWSAGAQQNVSALMGVTPGDKLFASCDAMAGGSMTSGFMRFWIAFYRDDGTYISDGGTFALALVPHDTASFTRFKFNCIAPSVAAGATEDPAKMRVVFSIDGPAAEVNSFYYVDNVSVIEQISTGTATEPDGSGGVRVKISGPLYEDISGGLNVRIADDFLVENVGGVDVLSQNFVDLAKATHFAGGEFTTGDATQPGLFVINKIVVNKLAAGDALFFGQATFATAGGGKLTINSLGITIANNLSSPTATLTLASSGATIANGNNNLQVTAFGLVIFQAGNLAVQIDGSGILIQKAGSSINITASATTITNGSFSVTTFASGQTITINIDATNWILITNSSTARFAEHAYSHFRIGTSSDSFVYGQLELFTLRCSDFSHNALILSPGMFQMDNLLSFNPGVGSNQFWYDPLDGNRVKYQP